jgi:hypothetical protein
MGQAFFHLKVNRCEKDYHRAEQLSTIDVKKEGATRS